MSEFRSNPYTKFWAGALVGHECPVQYIAPIAGLCQYGVKMPEPSVARGRAHERWVPGCVMFSEAPYPTDLFAGTLYSLVWKSDEVTFQPIHIIPKGSIV